MTFRQFIVFLLLTMMLIGLSYTLLDVIDHHLGWVLILIFSAGLVTDIFFLAKFFLRFMKR